MDEQQSLQQQEVELAEQLLRAPPDVDWCLLHQQANSIGRPLLPLQFCKCCGLNHHKVPLSLDQPTNALSFLGPGVPLFFNLISMSALLVLVSAAVYSIPALLLNVTKEPCQLAPCQPDLASFTRLTYLNLLLEPAASDIEDYLSLGCAAVQALVIMWMFRKLKQSTQECDERQTTASDYAVMLGLPTHYYGLRQLQVMFDIWASKISGLLPFDSDHSFPLADFVPVHEVSQLLALESCHEVSYQDAKLLKAQGKIVESVQAQALSSKAKRQIERRIKAGGFPRTKYVIVSFRYPAQKDALLRLHQSNPLSRLIRGDNRLKFLGTPVEVRQLSQPSDLNWQYFTSSASERALRAAASWGITFLVAVLCFVALLLIGVGAVQLGGSAAVLLIPSGLVLLNGLASLAISKMSFIDIKETRLDLWDTKARQIVLCLVLNSTVSFLGVLILLYSPTTLLDGTLALAVFFYFAVMLLAPFAFKLVNPALIGKRLTRRKVLKPFGSAGVSQKQANAAFQGEPVEQDREYGFAVGAVLVAAFWSPFQPLAYCFVLITLVLNALVQKYYFYRLYNDPRLIGSKLAFSMLSLLQFVPFLQTLGFFSVQFARTAYLPVVPQLWMSQFYVPYLIVPLSGVLFGILFWLLPLSLSPFMACLPPPGQEAMSYFEAQSRFTTSYQSENPISRSRDIAIKILRASPNKALRQLRPKLNKYALYQELPAYAVDISTVPRQSQQHKLLLESAPEEEQPRFNYESAQEEQAESGSGPEDRLLERGMLQELGIRPQARGRAKYEGLFRGQND